MMKYRRLMPIKGQREYTWLKQPLSVTSASYSDFTLYHLNPTISVSSRRAEEVA